jgi:hypothetical protein
MQQDSDPYAIWASVLVDRFFGAHMKGQRARLSVTKDLLDDQFPHLGGHRGFLKAVIRGPASFQTPNATAENFHEYAVRLFRLSNLPNQSCFKLPDQAPLYLPHLATLCLAWTIDGDDKKFHANAFYERLNVALPGTGLNPQLLGVWHKYWEALGEWTDRLGGARGIFRVETIGHAHVGIPLSQVILSPPKISRLPELFARSGLSNRWESVQESGIRQVLVNHKGPTTMAIGPMLFKEINDDTEVGKALVTRLKDYLAEPEFRQWHPHDIGHHQGPSNSQVCGTEIVNLRLVLESLEGPTPWRCQFGVLGVHPPSQTNNDWDFRKVDGRLGGLWLAFKNDDPVDAASGSGIWAGTEIHCPPAVGHDDKPTILKMAPRGIRIFHQTGWLGQCLLEEDYLPNAGGCFLLVSSDKRDAVERWVEILRDRGVTAQDFTDPGLPTWSKLLYLDRMELVGEDLLETFPEKAKVRSSGSSCIYLRGGSQIQGAGNQRLYLPFDPPDVVLTAPSDVYLESHGATLMNDFSGYAWKVPEGLPGVMPRQFRLVIEPGVPFVQISTQSAENPERKVELISFGVAQEGALQAGINENIEPGFDRLGVRISEADNSEGKIFGGSLSARLDLDAWTFDDRDFELGAPATEADIAHSVWDLLESLSQNRRVTAPEFKRRCERITGWWQSYAWSEARWIRALCHIEVERDTRGRIAYVYRVPPHAYLMPFKCKAQWLAVVAGCPTRLQLRRLLDSSRILDVHISSTQRASPLLPPRWVCHAANLQAIEMALNEADMQLVDATEKLPPLSAKTAYWAASLNQWKRTLHWIDGPAPASDQQFNPYKFKMIQGEEFKCPRKLLSLVDGLSSKHRWHLLSRYKIQTDTFHHAYLHDPSWGKWLSMSKITDSFLGNRGGEEATSVPLPYEPSTGSLYVPASLVFPTMLSRALATSSGMPPTLITDGVRYFSEPNSPFAIREHPYRGACYRYDDIPFEIAKVVCEKVGAIPVEPPVR